MVRAHVALAVIAVGLTATSCVDQPYGDPSPPRSSDPKVLRGAQPDVALEDATEVFDLPVPRDSALKQWGYFLSFTDVWLDMWLRDDCSYIDSYVQDAALDAGSPLPGGDDFSPRPFGHGWKLDPKTTSVYDAPHDKAEARFAITRPPDGQCDLYLSMLG